MQEEDISERLKLFESTVPHAWISWNDPNTICVEESSDDFLLSEGEYVLKEIVDQFQLLLIREYRSKIESNSSEAAFTIGHKRQKVVIKSTAIKKAGSIKCLWVALPEKDNSIMYLQNAAHDFRSPLGSIIGVVNLMQHMVRSDGQIDNDEMMTFLDMIKLNTDKALNLASEIMELAEIESEEYQLKVDMVVMKDFVQHYLATHRLLTLKKRIKVVFTSQSDAKVMLNEAKMTRALDNVLTNAVKFSKEGTRISLLLREEDGKIILSVTDEGIGMSKKILDNLFVKFGDSKRSGLDGEPTHGLGMSIVRQIMWLHQGEIKVSSEEGKGTQVNLILNKGE